MRYRLRFSIFAQKRADDVVVQGLRIGQGTNEVMTSTFGWSKWVANVNGTIALKLRSHPASVSFIDLHETCACPGSIELITSCKNVQCFGSTLYMCIAFRQQPLKKLHHGTRACSDALSTTGLKRLRTLTLRNAVRYLPRLDNSNCSIVFASQVAIPSLVLHSSLQLLKTQI